MTDRPLTVACQNHPAGATVLTVAGELDHHTAPRLDDAFREIPFADTPVVIDLSDLTYCDSTGITVLITAYHRALATDTRLFLVGVNPHLLRVFHTVGLDQVFAIRPTVEEALDAPRS